MIELKSVTPAFQSQQDQDHLNYIGGAISLALSPWNPGRVTFYTSNYGGPFLPSLTVETELLPRLPFSAQLDMLRLDEHQAMWKYADEAFEWFRYRHALPVPDNIILGSD